MYIHSLKSTQTTQNYHTIMKLVLSLKFDGGIYYHFFQDKQAEDVAE